MALIVAFVVAAGAAPLAGRFARRIGLVDRPGPLKVQTQPVPYLGGIAVLLGLAGPVVVTRPAVLVPLVVATGLGLGDDRSGLPARVRLAAEVAIGLAVGATIADGSPGLFVVAVVATIALVNAVNLLDGLDALAGGVTLVSALGFAGILAGGGATLALALGGGLAGFLVWNRPPARIYLGDSGSYLVGTVLAVLVVDAWATGAPTAAASLLLVGVPVADTAIAIVRRARARRPLLAGDRGHVYDQLVDRGWSSGATTAALIAAQIGLAVVAVIVAEQAATLAVVSAAIAVVVVGTPALALFARPRGRPKPDH